MQTAEPSTHTYVNLTLGALLLGCFASVLLFGVFCQQCFTFFHEFTKETRMIKGSVVAVWILACAKMAFMIQLIYTLTITDIGATHARLPMATVLLVAVPAASDALVRSLYLYRLWILSEKKWLLQIIPIASSMTITGLLTFLCVELNETRTLDFAPFRNRLFVADLALTMCTDSYIAVGICIFAWRHRSKALSRTTRSVLNMAMMYTLNTGLISCVGWLLCLITHVTMPHSYVAFAFYVTMNDLYNVCLLASLNAREWGSTKRRGSLTLRMSPALTRADDPLDTQKSGPSRHSSLPLEILCEVSTHTDIENSVIDIPHCL